MFRYEIARRLGTTPVTVSAKIDELGLAPPRLQARPERASRTGSRRRAS
jgi:hypothetical protein